MLLFFVHLRSQQKRT